MARVFISGLSQVVQNNAFSALGNQGSVAFWFNPNWSSGNGVTAVPFACSNNAGTAFAQIQHFSDNNMYCGPNSSSRLVFSDTGLFSSGVWANHILTWDVSATSITYNLNGVQKGSTGSGPSSVGSNVVVAFGNWPSDVSAQTANGTLADCAIWNVVLTATEMLAISKGARPRSIRPKNLILWWPLAGLATEPDMSGNSVNATTVTAPVAFGPPLLPFTMRRVQLMGPAVAPPPGNFWPNFFPVQP